MSICSNVSEQDLVNWRKLAKQQKNQQALKIKNRLLKQTRVIRLAESLSLITKKIDTINDSTKKLGEDIKEPISENEKDPEIVPVETESEDETILTNFRTLPNSSISSDLMRKRLRSLMFSSNSLRIKAPPSGPTILGVPLSTLGCDKMKTRDNDNDFTPEIYKALSSTTYSGKTMKDENDILMMNNIGRDLGYTGVGDRKYDTKTFFTIQLPKLAQEIQNKTFYEIDLQGEGVKIIRPSNINDIYSRLEKLLGIKLSRYTDTLTEANNLSDELYKRGEKQNKQQYRNALNKLQT